MRNPASMRLQPGSESAVPNISHEAAHPLLGKQAPDFAQKTVTGSKTISLRELSGKVAIVDFWATWCEPCRRSFPKLEAISAKYGSNGVKIVGVSEDDEKSGVGDFAANLGTNFPLVWDENKTIAAKWQPRTMPCMFVLDRGGKVRFVHVGYHDDDEVTIEREIRSLL